MLSIRFVLAGLAASLGLLFAVPVLLVGAPFWVIAALTRLIRRFVQRLEEHPAQWQEIIQFEPVLGWRPRPNLRVRASGELGSTYELTTDGDGWRGSRRLDDSDVVVFGDSFAFGHSADDGTFFAHVPSLVRIKAIGSNGYNMAQELLWMERLSTKLEGKLVVWFIFYGNDLYENLLPNYYHYRMPFVRSTNGTRAWEVVTSHVTRKPWSASARPSFGKGLAEICSDTPLSRRAWEACGSLLKLGSDVCRRAGSELVIMGIPSVRQLSADGRAGLAALSSDPQRCDPDLPDRTIAAICGKLGVPFVPLTQHLTRADYAGTHWSVRGHRRVANLIVELWCSYAPTRAAGDAARDPGTRSGEQPRVRSREEARPV